MKTDLLCATAYFFYLYEPILLAIYLYAKDDKATLRRFGWSFFITNLMGWLTFLLYPAAPPWYAIEYGMGPAKLDAVGSPARLLAID